MSNQTRSTFFATCAPGLEPILHKEIADLRFAKVERQVGGVRFDGTDKDMMKANLWLRTAGRVLKRLARFEAHGSEPLYRGVKDLPWELYLKKGGTLRVDAQTKDSELDHSRFVEQRIKDAVVDHVTALGHPRPEVVGEEADLRIHAHLFRNRVTLSLDSSGSGLRKRGYRVENGRAPLAETLAAGMVLASHWNGKAPMIDPFCGSGTLLIEAAMFACNMAPGRYRSSFGFQSWPGYVPKVFNKMMAEATAGERPLGKTRIIGHDKSPGHLRQAQTNVDAAGFGEQIALSVEDARDFTPLKGWNASIITNPPYGVRVSESEEMEPLYSDFAECLREHAEGCRLTVLTQAELVDTLDLGPGKQTLLRNGAIDCVLYTVDIKDRE
jgi:putative N6-adenine-specific DNA methylase